MPGIVGVSPPAGSDTVLSMMKFPPAKAWIVVADRREPFAPCSVTVLPAGAKGPRSPTTWNEVVAFVPVMMLRPPLKVVDRCRCCCRRGNAVRLSQDAILRKPKVLKTKRSRERR